MTNRLPRRHGVLTAVLLAAGLTWAVLLAGAGPAVAHATLVRSDPAEGAVLASAPDEIRFTFDEATLGVPDGVGVYDARGDQVESTATVDGHDLVVDLSEEVGEGSLVVVWRLVSEDGHPIGGSLTFAVGAPSASVEPPPGAVADSLPSLILSLVRGIGYAGLLVAGGVVAFTVLLLPAGQAAHRARARLVGAARIGGAVAGASWLVALPLTVAHQLGGSPSALTKGATWAALAPVEYVVTAAVVVGAGLAVGLLGGRRPSRSRDGGAMVAGAVATCAPALTGHTRAATPEAIVVGVDMLHLVAGSVWLGGLVALVLVLPDLAGRDATGGEVLARFSGLAAGVVAMLAATGSVQAWRILGSWNALLGTGYGRLLLVKVAAAVVAVLIAASNRFALMPRLRAATRRDDRRGAARLLVRATTVEAAVLVVVLVATGLLVDRSPQAGGFDVPAVAAVPAVRTGALGAVEVRATVSSPAVGPSDITIEMRDSAAEPFEGYEAPRARLSSDLVDLGDIPVDNIGPGTYTARVVLPTSGTWRLHVSLRLSERDNVVTTLPFSVGGG